jgi:hypothetical protein
MKTFTIVEITLWLAVLLAGAAIVFIACFDKSLA